MIDSIFNAPYSQPDPSQNLNKLCQTYKLLHNWNRNNLGKLETRLENN